MIHGVRSAMALMVLGLSALAAWAQVPIGKPGDLPPQAVELARKYPGVQAETIAGRVSMVYGRAMADAESPIAAAEAFIAGDIEVFGAGRPDLRLNRVNELLSSPSTVIVYEQSMDGLPVERGTIRIVVRSGLERHAVAYANARLAARPEGGFRPDAITADDAVALVAADPQWAVMQEFSRPTMVIYAGEGDEEHPVETIRAWKFWGAAMGMNSVPIKYEFFVDASTGNIAFARNAILHGTADVGGTVMGYGSPGLLPDDTYNPPALLPMPMIRVAVTGGNNAFTDTAGSFIINNALAGPLTVSAGVTGGRWTTVDNNAGGEISASVTGIFPPGPADIVLNSPAPPAGNSFTTAQVNAFIHQTLAHNYFRDRAPSFTALDSSVPANVNLNSTCNAFFDSIALSTNYYRQGESTQSPGVFCVNTAFSTVVAHEYGHFIVNRLGLAQGAFGEGFSDTIAMLLYDTGVVGQGFRLGNPASNVRNPEAANTPYPCPASCGGGSHCCGQIIGGVVREMRNNFVAAYGLETGLELVRQLHVDWALITGGGIGSNSAHPQTAIEFLTVDDIDSNLNNGTPNYALICDAFAQHGIACPALAPVDFVYPDGRPALASPFGGTPLNVNVVPIGSQPVPNTGEFFVSVAGGPFTSSPMVQTSTNQYTIAFPAAECGQTIRFYIRVGVQGGGFATDPADAPATTHSAIAGTSLNVTLDAAESSTGWLMGVPGDTATSGQWTFGDPIGTAAQPENDHTPDPGVNCFFTGQGTIGGGLGEADVDNGFTTLVSPVLDLSTAASARISYWRWYSNTTGAAPNADIFTIEVTSNGTNWVNVETVGPAGPQTNGGWFYNAFNVADFVPLSSMVRVRFIASDLAAGSLVEAAVDDFLVEVIECAPPPPTCLGDANRDGTVNFLDLTTVLANFGGPGPQGDADFDGDVDFTDATVVLANFLTVCE